MLSQQFQNREIFGNHFSKRISRMGSESKIERKPKFLCLHGFRTSGEILKKQIGKWPSSVLDRFDFDYLDGPFPAEGKSEVEKIFDPPYFEWFQFSTEDNDYVNFEKCVSYVEDYMIKHGPFDGLLGFSQGAVLSSLMVGLQEKGMAMMKVPKIKFLIIIGGARSKSPTLAAKALSSIFKCPSLHFLGEQDYLKPHGLKLMESFVDPLIIHHPKGHTIPRLDEKAVEVMESFLEKISKVMAEDKE